jgi:hypothetical protein
MINHAYVHFLHIVQKSIINDFDFQQITETGLVPRTRHTLFTILYLCILLRIHHCLINLTE